MSLWKIKSGWRYQFQAKGKSYSHCGFKTKEEARIAQEQHREIVIGTKVFSFGDQFALLRKPLKITITQTGCFLCLSHQGSNGYPQTKYDGRSVRLHRLIYTLLNGPIPPGMVIMHTCDNPNCLNPVHHRLGTYQENSLDMVKKGRNRHSKNTKPSQTLSQNRS
jgi:hypothetical protein